MCDRLGVSKRKQITQARKSASSWPENAGSEDAAGSSPSPAWPASLGPRSLLGRPASHMASCKRRCLEVNHIFRKVHLGSKCGPPFIKGHSPLWGIGQLESLWGITIMGRPLNSGPGYPDQFEATGNGLGRQSRALIPPREEKMMTILTLAGMSLFTKPS